MGWGGAGHVRRAAAGVSLAACLLGGVAPAVAAEGEARPTATLTFVPPNETKILTIGPASTTTTTTQAPAPARAPARTAPTTSTTIAPVSPALLALVEASAAERRRLSTEITDLEARIAGMEADLGTAQSGLATRQAAVGALELLVVRSRVEAGEADRRAAQLQESAAAAADAVRAPRTPVARPPSPGHTPRDAAAQAREDLSTAVEGQIEASRALADRESELYHARQAAAGASVDMAAKATELERARESLAGLRQQLAAAEQSAPVVPVAPPPSTEPFSSPRAGGLAATTIPADYLSRYGRAAATCRGLPWTVLAAVGAVESAHGLTAAEGVHSGANFAGAMGPMQFLAGTWAAYGVDGDGDGVRNVYDPDDAIFGAANYLCASGAGNVTTLRSALWHYNHADWYVEMVLELAARL
jgi:hypothetical protein